MRESQISNGWATWQRSLVHVFFLTALIASAQEHKVELFKVGDGVAQLRFYAATGFFFRLEMTHDLMHPFEAASGWFRGDGQFNQTPIYYKSLARPSDGLSNVFTIYPFTNGMSLIFSSKSDGSSLAGLVDQDYRRLPPFHVQPATANQDQLALLRGSLSWNPGYRSYDFDKLSAAAQLLLQPLVARYTEVTNTLAQDGPPESSNYGPGLALSGTNTFFRVNRLAEDQDGDGLDWASEVFLTGTDPLKPDTAGDGISDGFRDPDQDFIPNADEIQFGLNPRLDDAGMSGLAQTFTYDGLYRLRVVEVGGTIVWQATLDNQGNIKEISQ